jgi:SOS-response transcriptional repressor LexA
LINDPELLKAYVINIYKTIMYRGIKGTLIYACNQGMRDYLKQHIEIFKKEIPFRILRYDEVKPYVNSVPLLDISAAAGSFSDWQINSSDYQWIELPTNVSAKKGYFVCKVIGESMNKKIPNGSYCLFSKDEGGSRNGKIILVELYDKQDSESGSKFTIKQYISKKVVEENQWIHESITLKPLSNDSKFEPIELSGDEINGLGVVGIFVCVL